MVNRSIVLRATAAAALAVFAALPASSQTLEDYDYEDLALRGIGFDAGLIWPSNLESTEVYRLRVDLGYLGPGVRILPSISYWTTRIEEDEIRAFEEQLEARSGAAVDLGEIELSDLLFQVDGHFVWNTPIDVLTYLGVGVGIHALNGQGSAIDDTFIEDLFDSFMPGITAIGGAEYSIIDRLRIYGELRYTVVSDIQYPGVSLGLSLMLPERVQGVD